jgi:putative RNA methylase family UPF0020
LLDYYTLFMDISPCKSQREVGNYSPRSISLKALREKGLNDWNGSVASEESTLHQLSPYIGKMKSKMASTLISRFTRKGMTLYEPYCGSGTVALEAWTAERNVIAIDLNPYAVTLTRGKLFPLFSLEAALEEIDWFANRVESIAGTVDLRRVPRWVRSFFHSKTLRETIAWFEVLKSRRSHFLLSCLLGILHHQRPGFLSYPSSHTVPYLRGNNFPSNSYPELYEYRSVRQRLEKKVKRAFKRVPDLDFNLKRECSMRNAARFAPLNRIDAIVTSPSYMRQLHYGRDNRLRLWFLGLRDWKSLDRSVSPSEPRFFNGLRSSLRIWREFVRPRGLCVLVLGDAFSRIYDMPLSEAVATLATEEVGGYSLLWSYTEAIPLNRRVRRNCNGSLHETVLVLRKK